MLKTFPVFLLLSVLTIVFGETCIKYDFENDFDNVFSNDSTICQNFSPWQIESYLNIILRRPNKESTKFISPLRVVLGNEWQLLNSCIRSFEFPMIAGGTIEVMFYIDAVSLRDILYVTVSKIVPGGNDMEIGLARYSMANSDYRHGWHVLKINIGGDGEQFDGYIHFFGTVTEDAIILVDSFRYTGPNGENKDCEFDLDIETWTEDPTTIADSSTAIAEEHCTTYDFENDYDTLFNNESNILCKDSLSWELQSYSNIDIASPHPESSSFITPTIILTENSWQTFSSCVSSFKFNMVEVGSVEVKLYMEARSTSDILYIDVTQITADGSHVSIGTATYSLFNTDYSDGWKNLKIDTIGLTQEFEGYVSFLGISTEGSVLLIDSFRYIGSTTNEEICAAYTDVQTTTETPTTDNPTTVFVTDNPTTVTTIIPTTDNPITYNPTTTNPTTVKPTTDNPTTINPTTVKPTTDNPTTINPTTASATDNPTTITTVIPTTDNPTTDNPTTINPTTASVTDNPTTITTVIPTTDNPTTDNPTSINPTTNNLSTDRTTTTAATSSPVQEGICITYDFNDSFDSKFNNDSSLCYGFPSWELDSYTNINVLRPHVESSYFIAPTVVLSENTWQTISSCVRSFTFSMEVGGVIEVKFYMEGKVQSDNLLIAAIRTALDGTDLIINRAMYSMIDSDYKDGWNTIEVEITNVPDQVEGHILFLGTVSENAVLIVDSFRYIGPTVDEDNCVVYIDAEKTTSIPTTENPTTVTIPAVEEDVCVTYDFEDNFEGLFTNENFICVDFTTWHLGNYSSIGINGADERSDLFLTPNKDLSCIASFLFPMSPGGTVEVNVFMEPVSNVDYITVLAKMLVPNGIDTVAGLSMYDPSSTAFVRGWNVLRFPIASLTDFNGYLLFLGGATEGATVLIDSFRYIPPTVSADHESCAIY